MGAVVGLPTAVAPPYAPPTSRLSHKSSHKTKEIESGVALE